MDNSFVDINEVKTATAFSKQSLLFDDLYSGNKIVQYKRERVRTHIEQYLLSASHILELNSGTGEDAVWLAGQGHRVHATDIATGMQEMLIKKIKAAGMEQSVTTALCSFNQLQTLKERGPYDMIFSNFAGLNCTEDLDKVLLSLPGLVKAGGYISLVILPKFCLWEFLLLFKGQFKTAFRRFSNREGTKAHIEGEYFRCWYYNPSFIKQHLKTEFRVLKVEGLCTIVPPSYIEHFVEKHPRKYRFLRSLENKLKTVWPWSRMGDYYIITLQKK